MNSQKCKECEKINKKLDNLKKEYDNLENQFNENTIIQSMADMKDEYITLSNTLDFYKRNSVPSIRYETILSKYNKSIEVLNCSTTILKQMEYITEKVKTDKRYLSKLEMYILVLNDIINGHVSENQN